MYKLTFLFLATSCLAQASLSPSVAMSTAARNLTEDVEEAMLSTEMLITDCQVLIQDEQKMYDVISNDVFVIIQGILDKFTNFGVNPATVALLLSNISIAHMKIQTIINEQMLILTEFLQLLNTILKDLESTWNNLRNDLELLESGQIHLNLEFMNATIDIDVQLQVIENMINDVKISLTSEQAAEIDVDLASINALIDGQYAVVEVSMQQVDQGISYLADQLANITNQLPPFSYL